MVTVQIGTITQQLFQPEISQKIIRDYGLTGKYANPQSFTNAFLAALGQTPVPDPVAVSYTNNQVFEAAVRALGSNARKWSSFLVNEPALRNALLGYDPGKVISSGVSPGLLLQFLPGQTGSNDAHAIVTWAYLLDSTPDYYQTIIVPIAQKFKQLEPSLLPSELMLCLVAFLGTEPDQWGGDKALESVLPAPFLKNRWFGKWAHTSKIGNIKERNIICKKWKFPGMLYALGSEFMRNLGWNGFKIDRHIKRLFSKWMPAEDPVARRRADQLAGFFGVPVPGDLRDYFYNSLLGMSLSPSGVWYSHADNLVWALGAYVEKKGSESDIEYVR